MKVLNVTGCELYHATIVKGEGCYVIDSNGKKYLDFEAGVWALPLGHNNLRVNQAIIRQLGEISHTAYRYTHPIVEEAAADLLHIMQLDDGKCVFLSSGSEAVEFGIKIANKISGKPLLLNLDKHYLSAYGVAGSIKSTPWVSIDWQSGEKNQQNNYDVLLKDIPFENISAFVFEAGNSSGNVMLPPKELIQAIVSKVKEHGGWIVVDEVTTGIGRTGAWFGFQNYDIWPDIIACGKGLGNGYPVSAVGISKEACEMLERTDFAYGQSHQNDPLGAAVAKEVLAVISEEELLKQSLERGKYLVTKLKELSAKHNCVKEVRGIGLMCALEFESSVDSDTLSIIHKKLFDAGFIVGLRLATRVLRFYPPLIVEEDMIRDMVLALDGILEEMQ
ncbi:MAG: aspartate aminotransferase family protein [Herbinix sp.]|jgi:acetylornithine aminotransferase|nr:aspartate aminotransferase family protein [Herbinix sp.]